MVNAEVAAIDSLRIEPLSYALAFKVAGEAVHEESGNQQMDLKNVEKAIEHPELVESTNLGVNPRRTRVISFLVLMLAFGGSNGHSAAFQASP